MLMELAPFLFNAFVSGEGLNIEYVDANDIEEKYLKFKTFSISGL